MERFGKAGVAQG